MFNPAVDSKTVKEVAMDFESRTYGDVLVIRPLVQMIDAQNASSFKGWMVDYILQGEKKVALDLSGVDFMDSSGLSALISSAKTMQGRGRLVLCGVGTNVSRLLSITRLDRGVFEIHQDEERAVEALKGDD